MLVCVASRDARTVVKHARTYPQAPVVGRLERPTIAAGNQPFKQIPIAFWGDQGEEAESILGRGS